jgi:hypothetical protein
MMWPIHDSDLTRSLGQHTNFVACSVAGISEPLQSCLLAVTTNVRNLFLHIIAIGDTDSLEVGGIGLSSIVGGVS